MEKSICFGIGIHNHQPVGNFPAIFEDAYQKAYLPFIELLAAFPQIKLSLHNSGPLWDFYREKHPEYFEKLKALVLSGQVEILSGAYYEPILPNIPDRDKISQIKALTEAIKAETGYSAGGMWTAERVWEPSLPKPMAQAGIKYTILDESHFRYAGLAAQGIFGYYITEEAGFPLAIFPISYRLRHLIPFAEPEKTIEFLHQNATPEGDKLAVFADDGEKFGVWPGTYKTAYQEKWLERFFNLLKQNASWIKTVTFSEYLSWQPPAGRIYLPVASYFEMMEWALPTQAGKAFQQVIEEVQAEAKWEKLEPFLKGGFWRNFLVKYPESNNMQKKSLLVSEKVEQSRPLKDQAAFFAARKALWRGQCNCAYWHGVFGGLYLSHLRSAVYQNLIKAETIADNLLHQEQPFAEAHTLDFDADGREEIILNTDTLSLYFAPHSGGSLFELDYKPLAINFLDTMTRREEVYHQKILDLACNPQTQSSDQVSIHKMSRMKEPDLDKFLRYDWYRKSALIEHFLHPGTHLERFAMADYGEQGDFVNQPFNYLLSSEDKNLTLEMQRDGNVWIGDLFLPLKLKKTIKLSQDDSEFLVDYQLENPSECTLQLWFGIEWNLGFLSGNDGSSFYLINDAKPERSELASKGETTEVKKVTLVDGLRKVNFSLLLNPVSTLWRSPLETVSQSESGFEKTFQNAGLLFHWKLTLLPGEQKNFKQVIIITPWERQALELPLNEQRLAA